MNEDIETICSNYSFENMTTGDLLRAKAIVEKYTVISNGKKIFENSLLEYENYLNKKIKDAQLYLRALEKFKKESKYEVLFEGNKK